MPDYFSPGVYIEEFESGSRPMAGVSTSIPGFLGMTAKGYTVGLPQLITSAAEFKRTYGSYLNKSEYKDFRFLSYAIDLFFGNGGSACYVMRVQAPNASCAKCSINGRTLENPKEGKSSNINSVAKYLVKPIDFNTQELATSQDLTYKSNTVNGKKVSDVKISRLNNSTDYKTEKGKARFNISTHRDKESGESEKELVKVKDVLGHLFLVTREQSDSSGGEKTTEERYCIIYSANTKSSIIELNLYTYEDFLGKDDGAFYYRASKKVRKYSFVDIQMTVCINNEESANLYFAHMDSSNKCVDDLKNVINVKTDNYDIDLELSDDLLKALQNINDDPMKIIFGDKVDEGQIYPKGAGPTPRFANPLVDKLGKIHYECNGGINKVYISETTSIIEYLKIDKDKTNEEKLFLSYNGKENLTQELQGGVLKFEDNYGNYDYSFVNSINKEDNGYAVTLLEGKYNYQDIKFCQVEECPLVVYIDSNTKTNKLNFSELIKDTSNEIKIDGEYNKKISLYVDDDMKERLRSMKASPLQIISQNLNAIGKVEIDEGGTAPDFHKESLFDTKGRIYYTSNKEIYGKLEIVEDNSTSIGNLTIDTHNTNEDELILSYEGSIQLEEKLQGGILKFSNNHSQNYYAIIKSIHRKDSESNKYSVKLHKGTYSYSDLRFCGLKVVLIYVKIGDETSRLDFSKIINDTTSDTTIIWNENGIFINIDYTMKKNLLKMAGAPLKIIANDDSDKEEKKEVEIYKLCGTVEMTFTAIDIGVWGNKVSIIISNSEATKTKFCVPKGTEPSNCFRVKSVQGFNVGDIVVYYKKGSASTQSFDIITQIKDDMIELKKAQQSPEAGDILATCKLTFTVNYEETSEIFEDLVLNPQSTDFIDERLKKSNLITIETTPTSLDDYLKDVSKHPFEALSGTSPDSGKTMTIHLNSGSDGSIPSSSDEMIDYFTGEDENADIPGKRKGLNAFLDNEVVSMICIPGVTNALIQDAVINHCEKLKSRIAILDIPLNAEKTADVYAFKDNIHTDYAAVYHPWLEIYDPLEKKKIFVPPSGAVAGIYARSDNQYGVHKAPANEIVKSITGLSCYYNKQEQDFLNPRGINLIRSFSGQGIKIWGARTCSSNTLWKYVNVRRLFIYLEETIKTNTNWIVFEPNNELLWLRIKRTIEVFLDTVWRTGALMGSTPEEAYYVDIGRSTMTQDDIDNGRLICVIGVAPVKPAEFVIFRLTQKTQEN